MSRKNLAGKAVLLSFLLVFMLSGMAAATPSLPAAFYGSATINGRPAPTGSIITAQIDGATKGSAVVTIEGKYGASTMADGSPYLSVFDGNNGDIITFFIQTPTMSNTIQAAETGTWESGNVSINLDLTFTGEEIAKAAEPPASPASPGSSGSGDSGSSVNDTNPVSPSVPAVDEQQFQNLGSTYDISGNITAGSASVILGKGDEVKFTYNGKDISVKVKSMSDFAALFTTPGGDVVIAEKSSGQADIDGDGFAELNISLGKVSGGKAEATFSLLQKPKSTITSGPGATGMFFSNGSGLWISVSAIAIIAIVCSGIYFWRKRGV